MTVVVKELSSSSVKAGKDSWLLSVTVGATDKVEAASGCGPPRGVGDDKGVAKIFGVGVGGLNKAGESVGAICRLTYATTPNTRAKNAI
jgi:hypothetical protein